MHGTTFSRECAGCEVNSVKKIGVCDDESRERESISALIEAWGLSHRASLDIHHFSGGEELLAAIGHGERFDILFLDIYMGGKDGITVAREIRTVDDACAIVFTTNSPDHAIEGFGVRALHYLLKPIDSSALADALDRATGARASPRERLIQVEMGHKQYHVAVADVRYAESHARVVTVHTRSGGDINYYDKLDNFERLCDDERFLRCHKSFLVNLDYVQAIVNGAIRLDTGEEIPISKGVSGVKARFASYVAQRL